MIYEIINMSDPYTIDAPDLEIAAVACCLLGGGQYGFEPQDKNAEGVPLFLFGGSAAWFQKQFNADIDTVFERVMQSRKVELADCLDSCLIGKFSDRHDYDTALSLIESAENREKFRAERHDKRRSSMNDIGGRAYRAAKNLRETGDTPIERPPAQIFVA